MCQLNTQVVLVVVAQDENLKARVNTANLKSVTKNLKGSVENLKDILNQELNVLHEGFASKIIILYLLTFIQYNIIEQFPVEVEIW